jgi:hypothetical protein
VAVSDGYAYVAERNPGLGIYQFFGGGVEETHGAGLHVGTETPTFVRGALYLPAATSLKPQSSRWLLDAAGRKVLDLKPGANDVSRLAPGVYFIRQGLGIRGEGLGKTQKVVVTR